jgi:hypothetical protein
MLKAKPGQRYEVRRIWETYVRSGVAEQQGLIAGGASGITADHAS